MALVVLLFSGGLIFISGLVKLHRLALWAGAGSLLAALAAMMVQGNVQLWVIPGLVTMVAVAYLIKNSTRRLILIPAWIVFIVTVLALGFRVLPFFSRVPTLETIGLDGETLHLFEFPPEKLVLMLLVPPMVLLPWVTHSFAKVSLRPWFATTAVMAATLAIVTPVALIGGFITPGVPEASLAYLVYWLLYNLIFTCVLEEALFRGIVQTAFVRWLERIVQAPKAAVLGILAASLLFGIAHIGGGLLFVALATLAGIGYGLAYHLSGRLHHAVVVHFAVNAVGLLGFSGDTA